MGKNPTWWENSEDRFLIAAVRTDGAVLAVSKFLDL
jgi:hypothetical protein